MIIFINVVFNILQIYLFLLIFKKNNTRVLKEASICHSDEYTKAQNQIDKKHQGNEL